MKTAFVGWRGMVGSVLMARMEQENDFDHLDVEFYSTSQAGAPAPRGDGEVLDAGDLSRLAESDVILTCQGSSFTEATYGPLRDAGWKGAWVDAASALRMADDSVIVLDPVNRAVIDRALAQGVRTFAGGNCTVSLLLMALQPLFERRWIEWLTTMTYQAVSGAGAAAVQEMLEQVQLLGRDLEALGRVPALEQEKLVSGRLADGSLPSDAMGAPIFGSLLPWIDTAVEEGRTREEWKGHVETQKILGLDTPVAVDGICVRVPNLRCHSQALTVKLTEAVPLEEIEAALRAGHPWLEVVDNDKDATCSRLTPAAVTGSLRIAVGRLRKLRQGPDFLGLFTVGDQLLWGAAEPLRRMVRILAEDAGRIRGA